MKGLLKTLRGKWIKGPYSKFDRLLSRIIKIDLKTALRVFLSHQILGASNRPTSDFKQILRGSKK
jgi:hypothetical protein